MSQEQKIYMMKNTTKTYPHESVQKKKLTKNPKAPNLTPFMNINFRYIIEQNIKGKTTLKKTVFNHSPQCISSHRHFTISYHYKKVSTVRCFEREHIHITFITLYCHNGYIFLLLLFISYFA